ncbi:hypothetical protein N7495_007803 [Penicillium taxi]|uniref:uncharacterized protein n=1 Tax=Penicillium taxi TaxID=168475 RepID=UPI002545219D|nr:uncharacterized protein N7495_007803 [Penicillium taxi]KAJ5887762.1 hypothetical protein N7495_007803 [Penicillium taxi]
MSPCVRYQYWFFYPREMASKAQRARRCISGLILENEGDILDLWRWIMKLSWKLFVPAGEL